MLAAIWLACLHWCGASTALPESSSARQLEMAVRQLSLRAELFARVQRQNRDFSAYTGICRGNSGVNGGGGGIRTHETLSGLTVFKTAGVNHFPTPPN
jgi:hypothetical protein